MTLDHSDLMHYTWNGDRWIHFWRFSLTPSFSLFGLSNVFFWDEGLFSRFIDMGKKWRWGGEEGESVKWEWKKITGAQSLFFFHLPLSLLYSVEWPLKKGTGWNTKDLMKHLTLSDTLTHSHTASPFTAPSTGFFFYSRVLWGCNKTNKRQMVGEELPLPAFSTHLVIQLVSSPVNKSTIQSNEHTSWPGRQFSNSVQWGWHNIKSSLSTAKWPVSHTEKWRAWRN